MMENGDDDDFDYGPPPVLISISEIPIPDKRMRLAERQACNITIPPTPPPSVSVSTQTTERFKRQPTRSRFPTLTRKHKQFCKSQRKIKLEPKISIISHDDYTEKASSSHPVHGFPKPETQLIAHSVEKAASDAPIPNHSEPTAIGSNSNQLVVDSVEEHETASIHPVPYLAEPVNSASEQFIADCSEQKKSTNSVPQLAEPKTELGATTVELTTLSESITITTVPAALTCNQLAAIPKEQRVSSHSIMKLENAAKSIKLELNPEFNSNADIVVPPVDTNREPRKPTKKKSTPNSHVIESYVETIESVIMNSMEPIEESVIMNSVEPIEESVITNSMEPPPPCLTPYHPLIENDTDQEISVFLDNSMEKTLLDQTTNQLVAATNSMEQISSNLNPPNQTMINPLEPANSNDSESTLGTHRKKRETTPDDEEEEENVTITYFVSDSPRDSFLNPTPMLPSPSNRNIPPSSFPRSHNLTNQKRCYEQLDPSVQAFLAKTDTIIEFADQNCPQPLGPPKHQDRTSLPTHYRNKRKHGESFQMNEASDYPLRDKWNKFEMPRFPYRYSRSWTIPQFLHSNNGTTYILANYLGKGAFGYVFMGTRQGDGESYACKVQHWTIYNEENCQALLQELHIHQKLNHNNVMKIFDSFNFQRNFCIVMELCILGSLADAIRSRLPNKDHAKYFAFQLLTGLEYLHKVAKIVHCDIKPDNLMLNTSMVLKITDFGFAKKLFDRRNGTISMVGSPTHMSPEIIDGLDGGSPDFAKTDIWSAGVIIASFYMNGEPFNGNGKAETFERIKKLQWNRKLVRAKDAEAVELLDQIFVPAEKRVTAAQALKFSYLSKGVPKRVPITALGLQTGYFPNPRSDKVIRQNLEMVLSKYEELLTGNKLKPIVPKFKGTVEPETELSLYFPAEVHDLATGFGFVLKNGAKGQFNNDTSVSFLEPWFEFKFIHSIIYPRKFPGYSTSDPVNAESRFQELGKVSHYLHHYVDQIKDIPTHSKHLQSRNPKKGNPSPRLRWFNPQKTVLVFDNATLQMKISSEEETEAKIIVGNSYFVAFFTIAGKLLECHDLRKMEGKIHCPKLIKALESMKSVIAPVLELNPPFHMPFPDFEPTE